MGEELDESGEMSWLGAGEDEDVVNGSEAGDAAVVATDGRMACADRHVHWRPVSKRDRFAVACLVMAHRPGSSHQARYSVLRVDERTGRERNIAGECGGTKSD